MEGRKGRGKENRKKERKKVKQQRLQMRKIPRIGRSKEEWKGQGVNKQDM